MFLKLGWHVPNQNLVNEASGTCRTKYIENMKKDQNLQVGALDWMFSSNLEILNGN